MRWILLFAFGGICAASQLGCGPNMTESPAEIAHRQRHVLDVDVRELNEDVELFLLMDRPSRLSKWMVE